MRKFGILLLSVAVVCAAFTGCKKEQEDSAVAVTSISGVVTDMGGSGYKVSDLRKMVLEVDDRPLGESSVENGKFSIDLTNAIPSKLSSLFEELPDGSGMIFEENFPSLKNLKGAFGELYAICADADGGMSDPLYFGCDGDDGSVGFIYVDAPFAFSDSKTISIPIDEKGTLVSASIQLTLDLAKGWNMIHAQGDVETKSVVVSSVNAIPAGYKWRPQRD